LILRTNLVLDDPYIVVDDDSIRAIVVANPRTSMEEITKILNINI